MVRYTYTFKGGHYFINGLNVVVVLENENVASVFCTMLNNKYGDRALTLAEKATEIKKIEKLDNELTRKKLINEHGAMKLLLILEDLKKAGL